MSFSVHTAFPSLPSIPVATPCKSLDGNFEFWNAFPGFVARRLILWPYRITVADPGWTPIEAALKQPKTESTHAHQEASRRSQKSIGLNAGADLES